MPDATAQASATASVERRAWRQPLILGLAALAIAVDAFWMLQNLRGLVRSYQPIQQALQVREQLGAVMEQLLNAETGQRGYLLTRNPAYLQPYYQAQGELTRLLAQLDPALAGPSRAKLDELESTVNLMLAGRADEALQQVHTERGKLLMDGVRRAVSAQRLVQDQQLARASKQHEDDVQRSGWVFGLSVGFNVLLLSGVAAGALLDTRRRRLAAAAAREHNLALRQALAQTQAHNRHMRRLAELSQLLQTARDLGEAAQLLSHRLPALLEARGGALYLMAESRNQLQLLCRWGEGEPGAQHLPEDCWGLRRGRPFWQELAAGAATPLACVHLEGLPTGGNALCLPLSSGGELLGLLSLRQLSQDESAADADPFIASAAETIALALGNLRLRESLRQQSLRDALTGLHNRRYLEESLQRELVRAQRLRDSAGPDDAAAGVAVLMLDVDHFKRYNDQHGHEAGDLVLREVGRQLRQHCRESDIACRYGGEEFTLVLPQIAADKALERAEQVRLAVSGLRLDHKGLSLGGVTISIGLALFPEHGEAPEALLAAADAALYAAKRAGRDRVMRAGTELSAN